MKRVVSWSGGKDSALALREALREGDGGTALLTTLCEEDQRIGMHRVRLELLKEQAAALDLPLRVVPVPAKASNQEYEDRFLAALAEFSGQGVEEVVFGDLFLQDIRAYRDRLIERAGMRAVYPLWQRNTEALAREFIAEKFQAVLVSVDTTQIGGHFAGRWFNESLLRDLPSTADPCGENGEFHTFVSAGPIFRVPVAVKKAGQTFDGRFQYCDLEPVEAGGDRSVTKHCSKCAKPFRCGPQAGEENCWCFAMPRLPVLDPARNCLCPECLRGELEKGNIP